MDFWISHGFQDFGLDFWISGWISMTVYEISRVSDPSEGTEASFREGAGPNFLSGVREA